MVNPKYVKRCAKTMKRLNDVQMCKWCKNMYVFNNNDTLGHFASLI